MRNADSARVAIWQTATVHDESGKLLATGGQWTDQTTGRAITDPDVLRELEQRMATKKGDYTEGDRVVILDDAGDETDQIGTVEQDLGMGTYLILLDDGVNRIGTQPSHMHKIDDEEE